MTFRFRSFGAAALVAGSLSALPAFADTTLNVTYVLINLLIDLSYALTDPRIRYQ